MNERELDRLLEEHELDYDPEKFKNIHQYREHLEQRARELRGELLNTVNQIISNLDACASGERLKEAA